MRRRLFTLLSAGSLVLCAVTVVMWVSSYGHGRVLERVDSDSRVVIVWREGVISITRWDGSFAADANRIPPAVAGQWAYRTDPRVWPSFGGGRVFDFDAGDHYLKPVTNAISLRDWLTPLWAGRLRWRTAPLWVFTLALAVLPLAAGYRLLPRRATTGHCPSCGYDLRASPGRCPECGAIPAVAS